MSKEIIYMTLIIPAIIVGVLLAIKLPFENKTPRQEGQSMISFVAGKFGGFDVYVYSILGYIAMTAIPNTLV